MTGTAGRPRRTPLVTYRLQLHRGFPFAAAEQAIPYLARLGVTDCYLSPCFAARPGSTHGYDVTDHNRINPELGGREGYDRFAARLAEHGMGLILDVVPNHMGIDPASNPWWRDVLENGQCSEGARFFDIDWAPVKPELHGRVLLPILGQQYGHALEAGELTLVFADAGLELRYFDQRLPINPRWWPRVFRHEIERLEAELGADHPYLAEFLSILSGLEKLPRHTDARPEAIAERRREKAVQRERLARLLEAEPRIAAHIARAIAAFNGTPDVPASFDALHELLEGQPYRLAYWRTAAHEINYRRFFDINDLAALRVEDETVFEAVHRLLLDLLASGTVGGVRVDHPDGLFDPRDYFRRLQALARRAWGLEGDDADRPLYVVAEKILSGAEALPSDWAVHGTTGYNFLNEVNGLFVEPSAARRLRRAWMRFAGRTEPFEEVVYASKKLIMDTSLASELNVLAHAIDQIGELDRRSRDFTLNSIRDALMEVAACFPVYRTYVDTSGWQVRDRDIVDAAIRAARRRNPALESSVFDFLREVLLPRDPEEEARDAAAATDRRRGYPPRDEADRQRRLRVAMKFQQYTAPLQAKGLEDTAFYRYNVLLSLNEVGGDPAQFGRSPHSFHEANRRRRACWPFEMLATATHDTKLGEDVRARLDVLSELVDDWVRETSRWRRLNQAHRTLVDGEPAPDRADEYRFYQALVGVWPPEGPLEAPPALVERLRDYMIKSIKEAKLHTSWINENRAYDEATARFVERALTGAGGARFLPAFVPFQQRVARHGMVNSLAQLVLKLGSPGVPDFYQGTEVWSLTLVDPDNRRPVDFRALERLLDDLEPLLAERDPAARARGLGELLASWPDGRIKLFVTAAGLRLRRRLPALFLEGDYIPLEVESTVGADAVAFARVLGPRALIVVAPRLTARISGEQLPLGMDCWKTSRLLLPPDLAARSYRDELTGREPRIVRSRTSEWLFLGEVFDDCPVALLVAE
ncbi:MAG TPA: malto-oligosyltrehalose synthase [Vicinamibacterales bacterium]|nr:malto-oligosyltrehalose synthase [Vicinamibacterales bacterium]